MRSWPRWLQKSIIWLPMKELGWVCVRNMLIWVPIVIWTSCRLQRSRFLHWCYVESKTRNTFKIHPDLIWKNSLQKEFPLLYELARHLLEMSTQSADVECQCKAHKVIHNNEKLLEEFNSFQINLLLCHLVFA